MYFSQRLEAAEPNWKRRLAIPRRDCKGTPAELRTRIKRLYARLGRPSPDTAAWSQGRLYAEFFERSAEWIWREDWEWRSRKPASAPAAAVPAESKGPQALPSPAAST